VAAHVWVVRDDDHLKEMEIIGSPSVCVFDDGYCVAFAWIIYDTQVVLFCGPGMLTGRSGSRTGVVGLHVKRH